MPDPTDEELLIAYEREHLDVHYRTYGLWQRSRDEATLAILAQFDIGSIAAVLSVPLIEEGAFGAQQANKNREEALGQALRWITENGSDIRCARNVEGEVVVEARQFCRFAGNYVHLADFHRMYWRKQLGIEVDPQQKRVRFIWPTETNFAETVLSGAESFPLQLRRLRTLKNELDTHDPRTLLAPLKVAIADSEIKLTSVNRDTLRGFEKFTSALEGGQYDFVSDDTPLGEFNAGEFRRFFRPFRAWAHALISAHILRFASAPQKFDRSIRPTQVMSKAYFLETMEELSGLSAATVNAIVTTLTYDNRLPSPDIYLQPLLCVGPHIIWSPAVIQSTAYMRNLLKLLSKLTATRNSIATLIGDRSREMLRAFGRLISTQGKCQFKINTRLQVGELEGEVDLLAYNPQFPDQLLIIEAKAVLDSDEINEVHTVTEELRHGQQQLRRVSKLLAETPIGLRSEKFKFVNWNAVKHIYAMVLTPNSEPNQTFDHSEIPAISMATLEGRMRANHLASPLKLWTRCRDRPWLEGLRKYDRRYQSIHVGEVWYDVMTGSREPSQ